MSKKTWFSTAKGSKPEVAIFSDIGEFGITAENFYADLKALGPAKNLTITISSNGGDVSAGFAIYNMLKRHEAYKTVRIEGLAASMASVIAMAGDEIVMPSNAMMMVHNPWGGIVGGSDEIKSFGDALAIMRENIAGAYAARTKLPMATVFGMMDKETWLSASEAVRLGFADRIDQPMRMAAKIDVSNFQNVPASFVSFDALRVHAFSRFNRRKVGRK